MASPALHQREARAVEPEAESHTEVECPAGPESLGLTRFLWVRRREKEEEAGCAGTGRAECPSHSPACSHPPGPNCVLIKEQEPGSCQWLSALHTHPRAIL